MSLTACVWIGTISVLIAYEIYTILNRKEHDTLSESVWRAIYHRPVVSFAAGFLCGHWFFERECVGAAVACVFRALRLA